MNDQTSENIELLSPAGDWECVHAAIENGADAIYFGLDCGFNARFRAKNFGLPDLPDVMSLLRSRGIRAYVTMNTLVFPSELPRLVDVVEQVAEAGVDGVLIQDFGVARLVRTICPELEIHASTQMSLTSAETIAVAAQIGLARVVLARELSVAEIRKIALATDMPLEVFIHGALCVAYSGQCLTSESLGGRSANRGQCAQACRLPYELVCDGKYRDLGDQRYLLSPQDLAGYAAIPDLIDAGVRSLKIEGRLKTPEYVANITGHYRKAIDETLAGRGVNIDERSKREMELSFSRGFSPGWLEGNNHKQLVPAQSSAKRGIELGTIIEVQDGRLKVWLDAPVALGDGLAITNFEDDRTQGGRIYSLENDVLTRADSLAEGQAAWIGFGRGEIDWDQVNVDDSVFKNDDPKLNKRLRQTFSGQDAQRRRLMDVVVTAKVGSPLEITGRVGAFEETVRGTDLLSAARNQPATKEMIREKVARLGGTVFELGAFQANIHDQPMVPAGMLNRLRRELADLMADRVAKAPVRDVNVAAGRMLLENERAKDQPITPNHLTHLTVLCRTMEQLRAAIESDAVSVYVDFQDIREYREAVQVARSHNKPIGIATVRMQKPGEMGLLIAISKHNPDFVVARNLAAADYFLQRDVPVVADFSLNAANHLAANWLLGLGLQRITASYDLNRDQLLDVIRYAGGSAIEVVIHQHMPMFHMEHCVFCSVLSPGTNKTNCGRPCDDHVVQLRDRVGAEHTLQADVACRNTLYNEQAQSGAELVRELAELGVGHFRVELLNENAAETTSTLELYRELVSGEVSADSVWKQLKAINRVGVTRGTLETKRNPLAIL